MSGRKRKADELTLVEHLSELRWRLLICMLFLAVGICIGFMYAGDILVVILTLPGHLVYLSPAEAFYTHVRVAVWVGILWALPMVLYQLSAFVLPGLSQEEKWYIYVGVPVSVLLFILGIFFAYKVVVPVTYLFFINFSSEQLTAFISVGSYLSFLLGTVLPFGTIFQAPLLALMLTGTGILTPSFLSRNRKYAILCIFIIAALLTPPDVISQILMAGPLVLLFEVSVVVSRAVYWRRRTHSLS